MRLLCEYECPKSMAQAFELLASNTEERNLRILAGGTDLLLRVRSKKEEDDLVVVDISRMGLDYIREEPDGIHVGAMTTLNTAEHFFANMAQPLCLLKASAGRVGCWQTRNLATLMGNVCTGLTSADAAVSLLALDAQIVAESARGVRRIPLAEFFVKPRQLALKKDELATEVVLSKPAAPGCRFGSDFEKIGRRKELFISVLSVACVLALDEDGRICHIRLASGVLTPVPARLYNTEAFLVGKAPTEDVLSEASQIMRREIAPRDSVRGSKYYRENAGTAVMRRVVRNSAARALEG